MSLLRICRRLVLSVVLFTVLTPFVASLAVFWAMPGNASLPATCALIFGSAVVGGEYPGPAMERRMAAAIGLYKEGKVQRLILSGGRLGTTDLSEADVMRTVALEAGIPEVDLLHEPEARSTWENLVFSRPIAEKQCESTVAVSDGYHLARIRLLARRQGWAVSTFPSHNRPQASIFIWNVLREIAGIVYYGLFMDVLVPLAPGFQT
jgi:uncharacterized SAM-binding protein YcdF (DUF218 family)